MSIEKQIVFENQGQKLYGFVHLPDGTGPYPGVVLFDGWGGSSHGPRTMFAQVARLLADEGLAVLRFAFRGNGDSEGDFKDQTVEGEIGDGRAAIEFLQQQPGVGPSRIGVVGMSFGGLIAACTAARRRDVHALVLWAAVAHLGELWDAGFMSDKDELLRRDGYIDNGGWAVSAAMMAQARSTDGVTELASYKGPVLILHGTQDKSVPVEHAYRYQAALGDRAELAILEGADHTFSSLTWERTVNERTVAFLRHHLRAAVD